MSTELRWMTVFRQRVGWRETTDITDIKEFHSVGELDLAGTYAGNRCCVHIFKQQGAPSVARLLLRGEISRLDGLVLPPVMLKNDGSAQGNRTDH